MKPVPVLCIPIKTLFQIAFRVRKDFLFWAEKAKYIMQPISRKVRKKAAELLLRRLQRVEKIKETDFYTLADFEKRN